MLSITLDTSPTAGIFNSLRSLPELAPLSATVTTAVISIGNNFNPFNNCERPLPPPKITTFFLYFTI